MSSHCGFPPRPPLIELAIAFKTFTPVAMPTSLRSNSSLKSKSQQTQPSTQDLPTIPTIQEMDSWNGEILIRWIKQRNASILADDDLDTFKNLRFNGIAFLAADYRFFHKVCHLSPVASLGLEVLVDEVTNGRFISWT